MQLVKTAEKNGQIKQDPNIESNKTTDPELGQKKQFFHLVLRHRVNVMPETERKGSESCHSIA
ncbi:hypothetical protein [Erwinia typographi]|uniref:hypothetical protein n=1 Tax=Erwinia typographi TaxID=371042 RepID=UPI000A49C9BF|nr:hypothetical protein [Erwinia typographi]